MMRAAPPVAPPIGGFTGASPVRAMQAMVGGVNRTPFVNSQGLPALTQAGLDRPNIDPRRPPMTNPAGVNPSIPPAVLPSSPVGNVTSLGPGGFRPVPVLTQAGVNAPSINPAAPPLTNPAGVNPSMPPAVLPNSPVANVGNINAPQVKLPTSPAPSAVSPVAATRSPVTNAITSRATAAAPTFNGNPLTPTGTAKLPSSPAGADFSGVAPKTPGLTPASGGSGGNPAFGGTPTNSPTTSFNFYNAADPNRALKMMRGL